MELGRDDRGVSTVVGTVILFGFLVVLLSVYQAQIVPAENKQVEFDHSIVVQNDMLELRNAILTSDAEGRTTFATVKLGTTYQPRLIAINPAPPSGALRTGEPRNITVTDENGNTVTGLCPTSNPIQTRILSYTPGYNEYTDHPTIVYENSVLYLNFSGEHILLTDEQLVKGDTVNINPLNTSFEKTGVARVPVEPIPGLSKKRDVPGATVTYPTQLSEQTWEKLLSEDLPPSNVTVTNGELTIETGGKLTVSCSPLGLNEAPPGGSRTGAGVEINPAGPNDVEIRDFNRPSNEVVEVTFNNTGPKDANITEARVSFYHNPSDTGGDVGPLELYDQNGNLVITMEILGSKKPVDPEINLPGNGTRTTLTFENAGGEKFSQDDFFVVQFVFSNGKEGTYFVDIPS